MKANKLKSPKSNKAKIDYGSSIIPNFWLYLGITIILGCLGYFGYRYQQSNVLNQEIDNQQSSETELRVNTKDSELVTREQLSPEELSIAADLDNIDVILKEMEQSASQRNFVSVKDISNNKANKPSKFSSKINPKSSLDLLKAAESKTKVPSLSDTIERSSVQTVIEPSSSKNQIPLSSASQDLQKTDGDFSSNNRSLSSTGRLYDREQSFESDNLTTTNTEQSNTIDSISNRNSNSVDNQNNWRSSSEFKQRFSSVSNQGDQSRTVNNLGSFNFNKSTQLSTGKLSDYQINLQNFNRLVPRDYLAQPNTNNQFIQNQNNQQSQLRRPANYQGLNQFNSGNYSIATPNLSQSNSFPTTINQSNVNNINNSGLQPSSRLQPSGLLSIQN